MTQLTFKMLQVKRYKLFAF